jgi:N-acetylglucosamine-6-phosphate deacetylase
MNKALKNLVNQVGIPLEDALKMVSTTPALAIHQSDKLGKIQIGYPANLVCLNEALRVELLVTPN